MKKTIFCLSLFVIVSICFTTTVIAAPKITGIHGGYGVTATIEDARGLEWRIGIKGPYMLYGTITEGITPSVNTTIQTPLYPPALGFGKVIIRVTIDRIILPDITEVRTAFMLGPYVLFVKNIPSEHRN